MTKEITIRVEFNHKDERIKCDVLFQGEVLEHHNVDDKPIVDFAITPIRHKYFTDEEMNTLLSEFDEKLTSYEIIGIKEI